ncbi:hypothetical protein [Mesorhizobium muleiense]|uniref:hypothetical protein n=1 Tax=Mesorhizobium muleiense TaxID=1004279 RepID=UPI001F2D2928|nr:hypothetical protein [Mesorhizobium muleiense]MCF6111960.1 hypothetical protein [Mesorhizobium muleiense]
MTISKETSHQIAYAYREIETAEALLKEITDAVDRYKQPDIRDAFGHRQDGLQLGVPSGENSRRLFHVPWSMARPIIESHIAAQRSLLALLSEKARIELDAEAR